MVHSDAADPTPTRIAFPPGAATISSVAAGIKESGAVDEGGVLYMWGCGDLNMLGRGDDEDNVFAPEPVPVKQGYNHWQGQRVESCSIGAQHVMIRATPGHDGV
jgi:regulator of chromosome condensation